MPPPTDRVSLPYTVAIPIPANDRRGKLVPARLRSEWERRAVAELTARFGGATPIEATGEVRMEDGTTMIEAGQRVVVAGCSGVEVYRRHRSRIQDFALALKDALDQESVCVLAFPLSESYLLKEGERS